MPEDERHCRDRSFPSDSSPSSQHLGLEGFSIRNKTQVMHTEQTVFSVEPPLFFLWQEDAFKQLPKAAFSGKHWGITPLILVRGLQLQPCATS